ncbi:hypothetical protein AB8Q18_08380 [Neisseriaceae bacterium CLB008]
MDNGITNFLFGQIDHWMGTKQNGYLGSNYGVDFKQYLHRPMSTADANAIIAKMRQDIPALNSAPEGAVAVYIDDEKFDAKHLHIALFDKVRTYPIG